MHDRARSIRYRPVPQRYRYKPMVGNEMVDHAKPKAEKLAYRATPEYVPPAAPRQARSNVLSRQIVAQPRPGKPEQTTVRTRRSKLQIVLVGAACLVVGLGLLVNVQTVQTNQNARAQVSALSASGSNDDSGSRPSEKKPSYGSYSVAPNLPKYLKIGKLGVNSRVVPLGITAANQLKAPTNIYDTGWYNASAQPGDPGSNGAVLIDGHVHGPTLPGVFANIKKLVPGDTLQIVRGDNKIFNYKVVKVQNYDADTLDMSNLLASIHPGQPGLNLITCGGQFDRTSQEYKQRTAVFAVQI
jgi:sortase (surface protein transpeptidase)